MTDGAISEEELAKLMEGLDDQDADLFLGEENSASPVEVTAPPPAPKVEKALSQAEIDALLSSLGNS